MYKTLMIIAHMFILSQITKQNINKGGGTDHTQVEICTTCSLLVPHCLDRPAEFDRLFKMLRVLHYVSLADYAINWRCGLSLHTTKQCFPHFPTAYSLFSISTFHVYNVVNTFLVSSGQKGAKSQKEESHEVVI